ncbi:MAG: hypothetical protein HY423_09215 [Candidatus Lambdaproteobacteria bacterium]|nr:hypothetical protein [Candidatus Lambdaproteobacteria bacterium]
MKPVEVTVPDDLTKQLGDLSRKELDIALGLQVLAERQDVAIMRKSVNRFLLWSGGTVLGVSLFLIVCQAFGWSNLPDAAITTLIGSVAVEFVGMLWMVVRYLFQGGNRDEKR